MRRFFCCLTVFLILSPAAVIALEAESAAPHAELAGTLRLLDPARSELAEVFQEADDPAAAEALLRYFRTRTVPLAFDPADPMRDLETIERETHDASRPDDLLERRFTFQQVTVQFNDGIDWRHNIFDVEWAFTFQRHFHFQTLAEAWRQTGDGRYIEELIWQLREWDRQVEAHYPRRLEVGIRLDVWARLFPVIVQAEQFDTEVLGIFLRNVHAMAESLNARGIEGYSRGNWGTIEAMGVAQAAATFPEFREADGWQREASERLVQQMFTSTSSDGIYRGQSPHYHTVVVRRMDQFVRVLGAIGQPVPEDFNEHFHRMLDFALAYTRPDGHSPQFGDSDKDDMIPRLLAWGEEHGREDLIYRATGGDRGQPPPWQDRVFVDGGYAILRSAWEDGEDARWGMFDFGPHGRGGIRLLSVDLAAYGQPLVTMPGRYRYHTEDNLRHLFVSTQFQNTVSIDGRNQTVNPGRGLARQKTEGEMKVVHAWHDGFSFLTSPGEGAAPAGRIVHERQFVMVRDAYWVVADLVRVPPGERSYVFSQNWHFEPTELRPREEGRQFTTAFPEANVLIVPLAGEGESLIREGWHSRQYGMKERAPWLVYQHEGTGQWLFVTMFVPYRGTEIPKVRAQTVAVDRGARIHLEWETTGEREGLDIVFGEEVGEGRNLWRFHGADGTEGVETF